MGISLRHYLNIVRAKRRLFIWGTGKYSIKGEALLESLNITEWDYIDSAEVKQKNGHKGKRVYSIEEALLTKDCFICIAVLSSDLMVKELKDKGLRELDDFISIFKWEMYDSFLRSIGGASYTDFINMLDVRYLGEIGYGFPVCCKVYNRMDSIVAYSFGVGENISFDQELANIYGRAEIYAFDPTPRAIEFMKEYDKSNLSYFRFYAFGLSDNDGIQKFYLPKNKDYVSGSAVYNYSVDWNDYIEVKMYTLKKIMELLGHNHIDLLKLDIEGSEFAVLPQLLKDQIAIDQICVELHDRLIENGEEKRKELLALLRTNGYILVGISQTGEELTFIKEENIGINNFYNEG